MGLCHLPRLASLRHLPKALAAHPHAAITYGRTHLDHSFSGHNIEFEQPEAAVGTIVKMVEQIRQRASAIFTTQQWVIEVPAAEFTPGGRRRIAPSGYRSATDR